MQIVAVGVCGTDLEIVHGDYGDAPAGDDILVLGHESPGRVLEAPEFVIGHCRGGVTLFRRFAGLAQGSRAVP